MAVTGFDAERMAAITNLKVDTVRNLLKQGNEKFTRLKAAHERKVLSAQVMHEMWLEDHIEDAERATLAAIQSGDKRLAAEYGSKHLDRICPKRLERGTSPEVTINVKADLEIKEVVLDMRKQIAEVTEFLSTQDPNKHIKTGAEALPKALSANVAVSEAVNEKVELDSE